MHLRNNNPGPGGRPKSNQSRGLWLASLLACGLSVMTAAVPAPIGKSVPEEVLAARRRRIEQLNESDRKDLVRKYDAYRQMSDADRDRLRNLHHSVEADAELKQIKQRYCDWLKNLDITQREQLRQAQTPEQKRNLVVKFKQEQHQRRDELWRDQGPGKGPVVPISAEDLKSVMTAWEGELNKLKGITAERQAELDNLQGTQRYKLLMRTLAEYRHPKGEPERPFEIPDPVLDVMVSVVKNPELQKRLRGMRRDATRRPNMERDASVALLWSTMNEARREFHGPEADVLKEHAFKLIPQEFQVRYAQLPPWQQELALMQAYRAEMWQAFSDACDLPKPPSGRGPGPGRGWPFAFPGDRQRGQGQPGAMRPNRRGDDRPNDRPGEPTPNDRRLPRDSNP